jgi:hypothetical protein
LLIAADAATLAEEIVVTIRSELTRLEMAAKKQSERPDDLEQQE